MFKPATPNVIQGVLWMIFSCAMMAGVAALARDLTSDMHPYMVVFFRLATAQLCMLPWLFKNGIGVLKTDRMALYVARATFTLGGMLTWFYAVSIIPITDVVAISFVTPIFATVGAALILRETVRIRRWSATIVGFLGAMIILRPGVIEMTLAHWAVLVAAGCAAVTLLIVKSLSRREDPTKVVFYVGLYLLPISGALAWTVWERPPSHLWLGIAMIGPVATLAHVTLVKAMSLADASAILPFDFARLPFAALLGWLAFGEVSDAWTWIGAGVIFASSLYIGRREARMGRRLRLMEQPGVQ